MTCFLPCISIASHFSAYRYHIPRSWFKPSGNILVIFEEKGGDPTKIKFATRKISSVCAHISEDHPSFDLESYDGNKNVKNKATVKLSCPMNTSISTVKFASFGTPKGSCGNFAIGDCHDPNSASLVEKVRMETTLSILLLLEFCQFLMKF